MRAVKVIHPADRSTDDLKYLYENIEQSEVLTDPDMFSNTVSHFLNHREHDEIVMLLGHGCQNGLLSRFDDSGEPTYFDKSVVDHRHRHYLRRIPANRLIGIFCYASDFAQAEKLHGLFSGMFISEYKEAVELGVVTTEEEVKTEMKKFFVRLRSLLDADVPFQDIPDKMRELDDVKSPLTMFNYYSLYYI